eukprot:6179887-Pleurochrysis_carterae.AAC.7
MPRSTAACTREKKWLIACVVADGLATVFEIRELQPKERTASVNALPRLPLLQASPCRDTSWSESIHARGNRTCAPAADNQDDAQLRLTHALQLRGGACSVVAIKRERGDDHAEGRALVHYARLQRLAVLAVVVQHLQKRTRPADGLTRRGPYLLFNVELAADIFSPFCGH